jgi:peptidoglycan hydrolase CwlO-like protein
LCVCALACVPVVAGAQTTNDRVAATRSAVDKAAQRWFDAQNKAASLDERIQQLERDIATAEARATTARKVATARALLMYEGASQTYATILATDAMETARRAQLVGVANAKNADAIAELTASLDDLHHQQQQLETERNRQQKALAEVSSERQSLDAQLSSLTTKAQQEARAAALAAARKRTAHVVSEAASSNNAAPTATPAPRAAVVNTAPAPAPAPTGHGGVSAHHNDPFLVCTRARESGGNYGIVSSSGYYGAYQFLPSTWDVTANHAGRSDLVGVLPSRASAYDQDELAWSLYQWQGKGPWGGRC